MPDHAAHAQFSRFFSLFQAQIPVLKREKQHNLNLKPVGEITIRQAGAPHSSNSYFFTRARYLS